MERQETRILKQEHPLVASNKSESRKRILSDGNYLLNQITKLTDSVCHNKKKLYIIYSPLLPTLILMEDNQAFDA